ncbi:MAG: phosphoribosylformylglycinamidine synthase II, partial [Glaciecola sp.]
DIFTMGARPIALMNPLRFGNPASEDPDSAALQRRLIDGIVRGISGYGNCVGVPNIGGEVEFDDCYAGNPLVNVLAIGVMRQDRLQLAKAENVGDVAILLGSATGRDGIGGASVLASQEFDDGLEDKRPNVQVGDPFAEKLLIECCLELYERDLVRGIQDMGAAGIACSSSELASSASMGMRVDLDRIHLREPSMESWEILCSESQERMMALVAPESVDAVLAIAERWGVPASVCGEVVEGENLTLYRDGELIADCPARSLADEGPTYNRPMTRPDWLDAYAAIDAENVTLPEDLGAFLLTFVGSPNMASKRWIFEQYDHLVLGGTIAGPGQASAGIIRLPDSEKAVSCSTDGNSLWCELDPREGARRVVAESFRNVSATGARALGTTNCLNFGNPERPEIMWQLAQSIEGIGEACAALDVPITGGNVSLYNETNGRAINPTPVIGVLGVIDDATKVVDVAAKADGDTVLLIGAPSVDGLAASELRRFLKLPVGGVLARVDLDLELRLGGFLRGAADDRLLASCSDVSSGGLVTTLVETALSGARGLIVALPENVSVTQALFSEAPGRVVVTVSPADVDAVRAAAEKASLQVTTLGTIGGDAVKIAGVLDLDLAALRDAHETGLPKLVDPDVMA